MRYQLVDLFAGCGGMSLGFSRTGRFQTALAVEIDPAAAATYRANLGDHVYEGPIESVHEFPEADVVIGGPPCQGFSRLNMTGVGLERRDLWKEYLRALQAIRPRMFVMENVPPLLKSHEFAEFRAASTSLGYEVLAAVVNAADFGVPQQRKRAIVVGSLTPNFVWPARTHFPPHLAEQSAAAWRTFRHAVEGLPLEPNGKNWHRARNPTAMSVKRFKTIPLEGEGRFHLADRAPHLTPACWLRKETGSTDVFGRLWWDRPIGTIRTEFHKPEKGRYIHPSEHRPITPREAARCMTFPDDFMFPDEQSMTAVSRQIGNAVPPQLAEVFAVAVAAHLDHQSVEIVPQAPRG